MIEKNKRIALVAHDSRINDLIEWAEWNYEILIHHKIISTGKTGKLVEKAIKKKLSDEELCQFEVMKLKSGSLGGDRQLGVMLADGQIDLLIFLSDPIEPQANDIDVTALMRISVIYNIPTACNRSTADFILSSSLLDATYEPTLKDYSTSIERAAKSEK